MGFLLIFRLQLKILRNSQTIQIYWKQNQKNKENDENSNGNGAGTY